VRYAAQPDCLLQSPAENAVGRLVLLRHAEAGLRGRFCGLSNPALTSEGRNAIPRIIERLSPLPPCTVWSSDLRRAKQTASPIAKHFAVALRTSPDLREINFGQWEGLTWGDIEARFPEDARAYSECFPHHCPPGGESFHDFQKRVVAELERLTKMSEAQTLVVTHGGFIRTAVAWILGMPDRHILRIGVDYGTATVFEKAANHGLVTAINAGGLALGRRKGEGGK